MHSSIHSFTYPSIHLSINQSINHSFTYPSIHLSTHSYIHLFIYPSIHPTINSSIHPFTYPSIHLPTNSFVGLHPTIYCIIHSMHQFICSFISSFLLYPSIHKLMARNPPVRSSFHLFIRKSVTQLIHGSLNSTPVIDLTCDHPFIL